MQDTTAVPDIVAGSSGSGSGIDANYTSHRHKLSFFDGRLDDNNTKGVTTEMIPFASLRPCAFALNRERKGARDEKERKSQFMPVSSICEGVGKPRC